MKDTLKLKDSINSKTQLEILLTKEQIQSKVKELAKRISHDYNGRKPLIVGVLRGCVLFLADILKNLDIDVSIDFIAPSSYNGTKSTGSVRILLDLRENIEGKEIVIVEDIIDTGLTAKYLLDSLKARHPKSVALCALLDKKEARTTAVSINYAGFTIPDKFVVGYGLDYNELYRNLPYVAVLKDN